MMSITIVKYSVILVTQIKEIQIFKKKIDLLFPELWPFQILRKHQFSSKQLSKNPHCTKCISHRTTSNMYYERKLYKDFKSVIKCEIRALFIGLTS